MPFLKPLVSVLKVVVKLLPLDVVSPSFHKKIILEGKFGEKSANLSSKISISANN